MSSQHESASEQSLEPEIAILTAMKVEEDGIKGVFSEDRPPKSDDGYLRGSTEFGSFSAVIRSYVQGRAQAKGEALKLLRKYRSIRCVFFVGVAGLNSHQDKWPSPKLQQGDVIIPRRVIPVTKDRKKGRGHKSLSVDLLNQTPDTSKFTWVVKKEDWDIVKENFMAPGNTDDTQRINDRLKRLPKVIVGGTVATAWESVNDLNEWPDVKDAAVGFDTEGYDVAEACESSKCKCLIIRGFSDYCDRANLANHAQRDSINQPYASRVAAAICALSLRQMAINKFPKDDPLGSLSWEGNKYKRPLVLKSSTLKKLGGD